MKVAHGTGSRRQPWRRGGIALAAAATAAALGVATFGTLTAAAATAAETAQASDSPATAPASLGLDLTRIHGVLEPEGAVRLQARVTNRSLQDRDGLRLVMTMHQRTRWRGEYHQAMDAGVLGAAVHAGTTDVGPIPARGARTLDLELGAAEVGLARMVERGLEGVYPLRLQLLEGDEVADELLTSVVAVSERVDAPLAVAPVVTLAHPPSRDAGGVFVDLDLATQLEPGGSLDAGLETLAGRGDVPLTLVADALTLEETADLASGFLVPGGEGGPRADVRPSSSPESERARAFLSELGEAVTDPAVEVVPLPYASADLVALVRGGLASEAVRHLTDGARALEAATGRRPSDGLLVPPDAITADALAHALTTGTRAVVLSPSEIEMPQITGPTPSSLRRLRGGPGTSVQALVDDPWLDATLARPRAGPALAAQRVLGELATVYFERPNRERRGLMLRLEGGHGRALVEAMGAAPFLRPETLTRFRQTVREEPDPVRLAYPPEARRRELPPWYVAALRAARRDLGSLDGVLVNDRATPGQLDRVLLQAASVHHRGTGAPERGVALLDAVISTVEDLYARVEVPETPAVTLTGFEGELPVTVRSRADVPLRVRVHLRTARLAVEGGPTREVVLEPGSTHVLMLPVRALSPGGTAPVDVQVTDVDGEIVLARGQVVVRSTAFSVTAVIVVAGAALFLLVWLGQEAARRRQRPPASPPPVPRPAPGARVSAGAPDTTVANVARPPPARPEDGA